MYSKWKITPVEEKAQDDFFELMKLDEMIAYYENELKELEPILENEMYKCGKENMLDNRKGMLLSRINILKAHKEYILYGKNMIYGISNREVYI